MTPPDTSPVAPVDTSAEAVARMVTWLSGMAERGGKRAVNNIDARSLGRAGAILAAVVKERDEARAFVNGTMTEKLAEAIELTKFWREKADTASRQRAEAQTLLGEWVYDAQPELNRRTLDFLGDMEGNHHAVQAQPAANGMHDQSSGRDRPALDGQGDRQDLARQRDEARAALDDLSRAVLRDLRAEGEGQAADARKRLYDATNAARALLSGAI